MKILLFMFLFALCAFQTSKATTLYVDIRKGSDDNPGSRELPFQTIQKAVEWINTSQGQESVIVKIAPGLYTLDKGCLIKPSRSLTETTRLIIEALVMPDDSAWTPLDMPIIVSVENPIIPEKSPYIESWGFQVETSHVTIRGLKFIGTVIPKVMYYPIYRTGKDLEDLVVSQCMFLCSGDVTSSNVAVIANGRSLKIDHCVFYNCANAAVYWDAEGGVSKGNAMTHCLIDGGYVSGVWLCETGEDFKFHHNILTHCRYAFMRNESNQTTYQIEDCVINQCQYFSGKSDNSFNLSETGEAVHYSEKNVIKTGDIRLVTTPGLDLDIPRRYLQLEEGSVGTELGAGLFKQ